MARVCKNVQILCGKGKKLADIGTDHGYVPVCLLQSGKIPFAVAVDVHKGPLESAMNNASRCGVADKNALCVWRRPARGAAG